MTFSIKTSFLFTLILLATSTAFAADKQTVQRHAETFFVERQMETYNKRHQGASALPAHILRELKSPQQNCTDTGTSPKSCIETICNKLSKTDCDDASEIQNIAKICKNNVDGDCINAVCSKVSKFDCDDTSELKDIAGMCSGHFSSKCLTVTCSYLHKFDCDDLSEMDAILTNTCTPNVDPDCIQMVCSKMHKFDCDDLSEIQSVAKSCSSN